MGVAVARGTAGEGILVQLYAAHRMRILRLCRRYLDDPADAEDATQETFARVAQHLDEVTGNASAYLTMVARNVCIDEIRRRRARAGAMAHVPGAEADAAKTAVDRWLITRAMMGLSRSERSLIRLKHSGFTYDEIGRSQGRSGKAVSVALMRARQKARELAGAAFSFLPLVRARLAGRAREGIRTVVGGPAGPAQAATTHALIVAMLVASAAVVSPRPQQGGATRPPRLAHHSINWPGPGLARAGGAATREHGGGTAGGEFAVDGTLGHGLVIEAPAAVRQIAGGPQSPVCRLDCSTASRPVDSAGGAANSASRQVGAPVVIKP